MGKASGARPRNGAAAPLKTEEADLLSSNSIYGRVSEPWWSDRTVAIVAGGPSLLGFDFEQLRGAHVLAVKGAIFDIPWADAGFGLDVPRYTEWRDRLAEVPSRIYWAINEEQITKAEPAPAKNITFLRRLDGAQVSTDPGAIHSGGTSAFGAFQIGLHKRARIIVLFGFDYDGGNGTTKRGEQMAANWRKWAEHFRVFVPALAAAGISVVNACPQSAIPCFQKVALEDGVRILHG